MDLPVIIKAEKSSIIETMRLRFSKNQIAVKEAGRDQSCHSRLQVHHFHAPSADWNIDSD